MFLEFILTLKNTEKSNFLLFKTKQIEKIQYQNKCWNQLFHYYIKFSNCSMRVSKSDEVVQKLKRIAWVTLIFMGVQILGGIMANSIAILADAFHLLSDVLAYMISLQAVLFSLKSPTDTLSFGYKKMQPLGAFVNVIIIWFVTFQLVVEATNRIISQSVVKQPLYMLITAIFGLFCNIWVMKILHSDPDSGHDHDHQHHHHHHSLSNQQIKLDNDFVEDLESATTTVIAESSDDEDNQEHTFMNLNMEAAHVHILSDIILSVGVILSSIVIFIWGNREYWTYCQLIDPLCTYFFSVMAIFSTISIVKKSILILMDGCDNLNHLKEIKRQLFSKKYIEEYKLKLWAANRENHYAMLCIKLKEQNDLDEIWGDLKKIFDSRSIQSCIEIEPYKENIQ